MRVLLAPVGSRGDIQPMLALAIGLRDAGHTVTFSAPPNFGPWVRSYGFTFHGVGLDMEEFLRDVGINVFEGLRVLREHVGAQFQELAQPMDEADVIIGASLHVAGASYAEKSGKPYAYVIFTQSVFPSRAHPQPMVPWQSLPRWFNALTWKANDGLMNWLYRKAINGERAKLELPPIRNVWSHVLGSPILLATEPAIATPPADAPRNFRQTGAWPLPESGELEAPLEAFLQAGPPPVYIGFGSMPDKNPDRTSRILIESVQAIGVRAVISRGWAKLDMVDIPPNICLIGPNPHGKLFPRVAAVVHHGGAGTLTAAARAGLPQLLIPHIADQYHSAKCLYELGLSPAPISKSSLSTARLTAALRVLTTDLDIHARAKAFVPRLTTDGIPRAIAAIEELALNGRPPLAKAG